MSIAASLNDLGALATSRSAQMPRPRTERSGTERDDAFGQILRDSAQDRPEAPGRDAEWLQGRPRSENGRAGEPRGPENRPERPDLPDRPDLPEKPDLPAAAREHRSDQAKRGDGPRRKDQPDTRDAAETASDDASTTADVVTADGSDPNGCNAVKTEDATAQEVHAAQVLATAELPSDAMLPQVAATTDTAAPTVPLPVAPQVAGPAAPQPEAEATQPGVAAVSGSVTGATPAQAVNTTAAEAAANLVDSQPLPQTAATVAGEAEATPVVQKATEAVEATGGAAEAKQKKIASAEPETPPTASSADKPADKPAVAGHHHDKNAHVASNGQQQGAKNAGEGDQASGTQPSPAPPGHQGQNPGNAPSALEALRSAVAEVQPQAASPQTTGIVQVGPAGVANEARALASLQAAQRHEMPVPLQAVAIEIGMRAMRGAKEFAIRLDPEDLGRIDVKLEISDAGQVQAKVIVDKVETLQLLQRDARTLERAFDQAGLKTTPDGLQFSLRDPGNQGRNANDDQPSRDNRGGRSTEEPVIDEIRLQPAQYRLAASGGLDIRI